MSAKASVLVTDGDQRATLAVVRSLGRAGYRVVVGSSRRRSLAGVSRFAAASVRLPDPGSIGWIEALHAAVLREGADVVIPMTEPSLIATLPRAGELAPARIAGPDSTQFERIRDKATLLAAAADLGLYVPEQVTWRPGDSPSSEALQSIGFPVVIKPVRSVALADDGPRKLSVGYARDAAALRSALAALPPGAGSVLLQRHISGPGIGIFGLLWDGRPLARFAHRRIREKPPWGGVSVCSESVAADPSLIEGSFRLLAHFDWKGPAMVEYKVDERTGRAYVMEVNGRFWGSLQLALHAGVDFPRLLVDAVLGETVVPVTDYRSGVRNHWELGEIDAALTRWRRPDPRTGRREPLTRVIGDLLRWRPGRDRAEVFRLSDPLPFVAESIAWIQGA